MKAQVLRDGCVGGIDRDGFEGRVKFVEVVTNFINGFLFGFGELASGG